jgi:hypothetical protein
MDALALIRLHLQLECKEVFNDFLMREIHCADPDGIHRVYIAQHSGGYALYFRNDLSPELIAQIRAMPPEQVFTDYDRIAALLGGSEDIFIGKSYVFPPMDASLYPDGVPLGNGKFGILANGIEISTCESSREDDFAAEAWVITQPEFRGRGCAKQVTAAWAHHLQQRGKTPFYSHKITNLASQGVARSLNLIQYIADVGYP